MLAIDQTIAQYCKARKDINDDLIALGIPHNDNIVGRIGEYYASQYFIRKGKTVIFATKPNEEGYDFKIDHIRYSVKTITAENNVGSTSPLKLNKKWGYLIAVKLDSDFNLMALSIVAYKKVKNYLDENSRKQNKAPSNSKLFRWWRFLDESKIP